MLREQEKQARTWGMLCHLSALVALLGIPFGNILGPLVVWLVKRNDDIFIDEQGKESLNFQISMTIYFALAGVLALILVGIVIMVGLIIANVILVVLASIKTSNGESYRYPLTIKFIT